jgi:CheY-like chemotaxis protein
MIKIIFMIDDDADDREIFREALLTSNPKVELSFAADGVEALEKLKASAVKPDAIFLDYNMPRMNGIDCLRALKKDKETKEIPVVMYTTSGDREQEKVIMLLGASYYMKKTTSFQHLCSELNRLLEDIGRKQSPMHTKTQRQER